MARNRFQERKTKAADRAERFDAHLAVLGLRSIAEYHAFCSQHGFSTRTDKTARQRETERDARRSDKHRRAEREEDRVRERYETALELLAGKEPRWCDRQQPCELMRRAFAPAQECRRTRAYVERLLRHLHAHDFVFSTYPAMRELGATHGNTYLEALVRFGRHADRWIRAPEAWKPNPYHQDRDVADLAHHLFAVWPVPRCLDAVWFLPNSYEGEERREWFLHVAGGGNIRHRSLPLPYTKLMAHHFMLSPSGLSLGAGLRWGQVLGLGGSEVLAQAVAGTRLSIEFTDNEFWESVIRWLVAQTTLDPGHVGPIVDYVRHQRFATGEDRVGRRREEAPPAQPRFSTRGRTVEAILRAVEQWHGRLARGEDFMPTAWKASGLKPLEFTDGATGSDDETIWTVRELLTSRELLEEGRAMHHCVASYAGLCAQGHSSIWAVESETIAARRKELTLEVRPKSREIVQVRGKCNSAPTGRQQEIVKRWAEAAGLTIALGA